MKIAITYQNQREITGHAGKTSRFLVYTLNASTNEVESKELVNLAKEDILHNRFHESADPYAAHPLFEVDYIITTGAGTGFVNRLATQSVKVLITTETDPEQAVSLLIKDMLPLLPAHHHHH